MLWRRRWLALLALASHLAGVIVLPALHRAGHRADHIHVGAETLWLDAPLVDQPPEPPLASDLHERFDEQLDALDLLDVAHAGVATVDCELARYTLADCEGEAPGAGSHGFGDELAARTHRHRHAPASNDDHGAQSLAHGTLGVLPAVPPLLPPPPGVIAPADCIASLPTPPASFLLALRARAPPAARFSTSG